MIKGEDFTGVSIIYYCHDGDGNFLFNKRGKNCRDENGNWDCGGGGLEFSDTVEDTHARRLQDRRSLPFPYDPLTSCGGTVPTRENLRSRSPRMPGRCR